MSQGVSGRRKKSFLREIASVVIPALLLAVAIQTFLFRPFRIPSESMKPTLLIGDYLFVSKYSYGYSRYSLPFSPPLFSGRLLAALPQRGDVAVFRLPTDDTQDLIKRVIGFPGERIQMREGLLHINGVPVVRERMPDYFDREEDPPVRTEQWRETLPNGVSHVTLNLVNGGPLDDTPVYRVPPGHYFMMGDNRDKFDRQPGALRGRLRSFREFHRPGRDRVFLDRKRRKCLAGLALANECSSAPAVHLGPLALAEGRPGAHL
jgi:signal peptidase I